MGSSTSFKAYRRGGRNQLSERTYGSGMSWTNAPLPEGFSHTLVNYDYKDQGDSLIPRMGLRAFEFAAFPIQYVTAGTVYPFTEGMTIADGKHCAEANKVYEQLIITDTSGLQVDEDTGFIKGAGYLYTVLPEGDTLEAQSPPALSGIPVREIHAERLHSVDGYLFFRNPENVGIHKVPLATPQYTPNQIGTFAFNNSYYCFRKEMVEGALKPQLIRTVLHENGYYTPEVISPKELTPKEAVMWGYNMLHATPYNFKNVESAGVIQLLGTLPYDENNNLVMSPVVNQSLQLECFYAAANPSTHKFVWEWKDPGASEWTKLKEETLDTGAKARALCTFSAPTTSALIKVSAYEGTATDPDQVLVIGLNFNKAAYGSTANINPKVYNLHSCTGMAYWKNQLVVYGPKEDRTMLFVSDINDPGYFPFPNKADTFEEPVVFALPFLDELLVFTTTTLYILTMSADGLSWTKKVLQRNLDIKEWDLHLIQSVKNMVFFKSGNFYYMVVPSSKGDGSLTIAPVSRYIEPFLLDFMNNVREVVLQAYDYEDSLDLIHYYNFLDYEDIHNVYVFKTNTGALLNFTLLYNTVNRSWRFYLSESQRIVRPFRQDATTRGTFVTLTACEQRYILEDVVTTETLPCVQFLRYSDLEVADFYIPQGIKYQPELNAENPDNSDDPYAVYDITRRYRNYQIWDSGYREQNSDKKKRYREFQIKLNNISQRTLRFYSEFYIDGEQRKGMYRYVSKHIQDPTSPDYGLLYIERELIDPDLIPGTTLLAESEEDNDTWELDMSLFPEMTLWKVRIPVSGKGYTPRFLLVSRNEKAYELLNHNWVFREMYSR